MTSAFNSNFKNMLLIIAKAAAREQDCPMNETIMGAIIDYIFGDKSNVSKICPRFVESIEKLNKIYKDKPNATFEGALLAKDRDIFNHIDLFPPEMYEKYRERIDWLSLFLVKRMQSSHMEVIWKYLDKLYVQSYNKDYTRSK